jgi:protease I
MPFAADAPASATTALRRDSDRQPDAPVGWAIGALRRSPEPSVVAVAGIGLAAAAPRVLRGAAARS